MFGNLHKADRLCCADADGAPGDAGGSQSAAGGSPPLYSLRQHTDPGVQQLSLLRSVLWARFFKSRQIFSENMTQSISPGGSYPINIMTHS